MSYWDILPPEMHHEIYKRLHRQLLNDCFIELKTDVFIDKYNDGPHTHGITIKKRKYTYTCDKDLVYDRWNVKIKVWGICWNMYGCYNRVLWEYGGVYRSQNFFKPLTKHLLIDQLICLF